VPVFVFGRPAFAQGVGEDLTAVDLPDRAYWIVRPPVSVSTADVFRHPDLTRDSESVKIAVFADWQTGQGGFFGRNDLEAVVFRQHPGIAGLAQAMRGAGIEIRMTGSGSCLFAEFPDAAQARMHRDRIIGKMQNPPDAAIEGSWICQGLADHPLLGWVAD
jgi:4-diphosphocytidyl-2-C-methyl-D-erythritol kinase